SRDRTSDYPPWSGTSAALESAQRLAAAIRRSLSGESIYRDRSVLHRRKYRKSGWFETQVHSAKLSRWVQAPGEILAPRSPPLNYSEPYGICVHCFSRAYAHRQVWRLAGTVQRRGSRRDCSKRGVSSLGYRAG